MDVSPTPADDGKRLAALRQYSLVDAPPAPALRELTQLAAAVCQTPIAFIAFVDDVRQKIVTPVGVEAFDGPRDGSFASLFIGRTLPLVVADARTDERVARDPLRTGATQARFYAGAPLLAPGR